MYRVANIFTSIDGEVNEFGQGCFATFIRLAGCNLKCFYCDTPWSQLATDGKNMSAQDIINQVVKLGCNKVTITGGEPLSQPVSTLICDLYHQDVDISVETNGTLPLPRECINKASWIVDYKIGEHFCDENLAMLLPKDFIKIVVWDADSYRQAKDFYRKNDGLTLARFAFSPVSSQLSHAQLCEWMIQDKLFDVILNCQIHKFIWAKENMNDHDRIEH